MNVCIFVKNSKISKLLCFFLVKKTLDKTQSTRSNLEHFVKKFSTNENRTVNTQKQQARLDLICNFFTQKEFSKPKQMYRYITI